MTQPGGSCPPTEADSAIDDTQRLMAKMETARAKAVAPQYFDSGSTVQDILMIIPTNTEARRAFFILSPSQQSWATSILSMPSTSASLAIVLLLVTRQEMSKVVRRRMKHHPAHPL